MGKSRSSLVCVRQSEPSRVDVVTPVLCNPPVNAVAAVSGETRCPEIIGHASPCRAALAPGLHCVRTKTRLAAGAASSYYFIVSSVAKCRREIHPAQCTRVPRARIPTSYDRCVLLLVTNAYDRSTPGTEFVQEFERAGGSRLVSNWLSVRNSRVA